MPQGGYLPEGMIIDTEKNQSLISGHAGLLKAMSEGTILEAMATVCDESRSLTVDLNGIKGIIPRSETAIGIDSGQTRDIAVISRVGKPVCFKVMDRIGDRYILSRRLAQREALDYFMDELKEGEIIRCAVTHLEPFGVFVDIGCGNISLIGIENISVSRIIHPRERFFPGQYIYAAVLSKRSGIDRLTLTHRELLGTWEENSSRLSPGQTTIGTVRGIEDYGIFVELRPNLSGLAERREGLETGDAVSVFIKSILPDKMKVKLIIIDRLMRKGSGVITDSDYYLTEGRIKNWVYSPSGCKNKYIATIFGGGEA